MIKSKWNRRDVLAASAALGTLPGAAFAMSAEMLHRKIPSSSESLPVIGLGT
jgi:hypothetical protein